jgi:hypothetical protein
MARREEATLCGVCGRQPVSDELPRMVCRRCDALALNSAGRPPQARPDATDGDNPIYIDGKQCWRRYSVDGWATMLDPDNCRDYFQFCKLNGIPAEGD